jgi:hypothetical protein
LAPYSLADWERDWDDSAKLPCPRCGNSEDYGARQSVLADRSFRRYRACKRCGMFQEADGHSAPYQTVLLVHECGEHLGADSQCRSCGMRPRKGGTGKHLCPRIVREGETFSCLECGTKLGEQHQKDWPEKRLEG